MSANKALADMLGCEVQTLIGQNFSQALGIDRENLQSDITALEPGRIFELPMVTVRHEGSAPRHVKPFLFLDALQKDSLFWHLSDQTASFELERKFADLIENVPVGLFWADLNGGFNLVNPGFREIFAGGKIPRSMEELLSKEGWESIRKKVMEGGAQKAGLIFGEGDCRINLALKVKLCEHGGTACLAGILKDVTEQVRLNESLEEAYRKAEAASHAKSIFLSHMSHELRTPLNVVQGMASLLEDRVGDADTMELVLDLKKASEHLTSLIGEILDLAKIEAGRLDLDLKPFDMQHLLEDLESVLGVQARFKDLAFTAVMAEGTHRFYRGDPVRIRQMIFNLAGNSLKLTREGEVSITVCSRGESENGRELIEISVSDTGPGIPEELLPGLFEPFVQADEGRKAGGTGLGLSITRELAELMGGGITVESQEGSGTTFRVNIPLERLDAGDMPARNKDKKGLIPSPGRALVVDDVAMNRKVLRMFLEKRGWEAVEAENGRQALDILEQRQDFQVIFMDVSMPVMDGLEATSRIKRQDSLREIPVVGVTAHAMSDDRKRFIDAGMDGYVSKPVRPERLWAEVARLLGTGGGNAPLSIVSERKEARKHTGGSAGDLLLDFEALVETCEGMEDLAMELVQELSRECPKWLKEAEEAVKDGDAARIRKICHLIRGTASTVHAKELQIAAEALGKAAREGKNGELFPRFQELQSAIYRLEKWLRDNLLFQEAVAKLETLSRSASTVSCLHKA